jgi:protein-disulfide isomerase
MHTVRFRFALATAAAAILPLFSAAAADSPQPGASGQARVENAIHAYVEKQQADEEKAQDQRVANHVTDLLGDPMSPVIGNPNGDVTVIEFFDYTCPYCKALEPRLEKLIRDDKGVKLILKEFPILTPASLIAAKAALASVKQGKYEPFHNALIGFKGRLTDEAIFDTAKEVGLDVARLRKDMDAPEIADEIIANFNLARALHILGTPGLIAGAHMLTGPSAEIDFPKVAARVRSAKG